MLGILACIVIFSWIKIEEAKHKASLARMEREAEEKYKDLSFSEMWEIISKDKKYL